VTPRAKWPSGVAKTLALPEQTLAANLIASAQKFAQRTAIIFHGAHYDYQTLLDRVEKLSGYLQHSQGLKPGDRVLLFMQNSPQFVISYYAILHAGGVVVPVNPMSRSAELDYIRSDTDAKIICHGAELCEVVAPLLKAGKFDCALLADYAQMANPNYDLPLPKGLQKRDLTPLTAKGFTLWQSVIDSHNGAEPATISPDDLAVIPYSSGTTGQPKGCMHSHRTVMVTAVGGVQWYSMDENCVSLATMPMFHVTGMQAVMNGPVYAGGTVVIMTRWDRRIAAELIQRYGVTRWRSIAAMAIDFANMPDLERYDLSSLRAIGGGGAAMPAPVAHRLKTITGLDYIEGYGLSETMAATHINPVEDARPQCLGIPVFDVDACVWSPQSGAKLGANEVGEILLTGPQLFLGYWQRPKETEEVFVTVDGTRYFRTGDMGYVDEDGYFYMVDRLKRMINAAGFKVWPAEVEAIMHGHPDIDEVCVIGITDTRRGETAKAVIVPADRENPPDPADIITWCKTNMAAYKCPTHIEFVANLPKSGSSKVLWRELTEQARQSE